MKDKEKQIEEMQKIMEYCCNVYDDKGRHIRNKCNTFDCEYYCDTNNVCCSFSKKEATALYDAGYRKLPKNSVVISKEEYEDLQVGKDFDYGYHEGYKNTEAYYENFKLPEARKETAEKILFNFESAFAYYDNEDMFSKKAIFECLYELAKQFGVEIKE